MAYLKLHNTVCGGWVAQCVSVAHATPRLRNHQDCHPPQRPPRCGEARTLEQGGRHPASTPQHSTAPAHSLATVSREAEEERRCGWRQQCGEACSADGECSGGAMNWTAWHGLHMAGKY
ncbi:hypothetical protein E2C01_059928 [Portunus trituberculatus]|uniref:Uncharacterized protein n=1 Tax=Portunus trituberculatus TaxID=210409 RepID=A0A5B7H3Y5_PORTR|nr:hypothetical protein [Portunus trituberculatus]